MKVVIDTSSLLALVRYYLPFDKDDSLKNFIQKKVESKEMIVLDKVCDESKYVAQGIIVKSLGFIEDKKNLVNTELLLPKPHFLSDLENRLCYGSAKNKLNETEFENRKQNFLKNADAKLILYCLKNKTVLVTEETKAENDNKLFKKLPVICELLDIDHCTLPTLFKEHYKMRLSEYLE